MPTLCAVFILAVPAAYADGSSSSSSSSSSTTTTTHTSMAPGNPAVQPPPSGPDTANLVFVGGTPIYRVRVAGGGLSIAQRAEKIQDRVNTVLGIGPIRPSDITVGPVGDEEAVYVKGKLILTADLATAKYNHSSPGQLANIWAQNLRNILPGLTQAE